MLMDDEFGVIDPEEGEVLDLVRGEEGSEYKIMSILRFCFFCFHFDTNDEDINLVLIMINSYRSFVIILLFKISNYLSINRFYF